MATNTPIGKGKVITSDQFNELVSVYNTHWSDDIPNATFSELNQNTKDSHSRGWGMGNVVPVVNKDMIIKAEHINELLAQVNAGSLHREYQPYIPLPAEAMYSPKAIIYSSVYMRLKSYMDILKSNTLVNLGSSVQSLPDEFDIYDIEEMPRFLLNPNYSDLSLDVEVISASPIWNTSQNDNTIYMESKSTFSSYQQARYFFNSGGKIIFDLESVGGYGTNYWEYILGGIGQIRVGACNVLLPHAKVNITPSFTGNAQGEYLRGGIYDMNDNGGDWVEIFSAVGKSAGEYGYGEYGDSEYFGIGEYATRRVSLDVKGNQEQDGKFSVHYRIRLIDNITVNKILNNEFIARMGYIHPLDAPDDDELSAPFGDLYKVFNVDNTVKAEYQFLEREEPDLVEISSWQVL